LIFQFAILNSLSSWMFGAQEALDNARTAKQAGRL